MKSQDTIGRQIQQKEVASMTKIKAVIFDMDGLMFDTETVYYKANQLTADKYDMDFTKETYMQYVGAGDDIYFAGLREQFKNHPHIETFLKESTKKAEELLLKGQVDKKDGLIELLDYLTKEKIVCIVASSSHREMVDKLTQRLGVRKYFKEMVGGNEVPTAKPDPAIFEKAFAKTNLKNKEEALILEDSKNGILAAHRAGIPVILVPDLLEPDDEMKEKAVALKENLHQVIDYINEKNV